MPKNCRVIRAGQHATGIALLLLVSALSFAIPLMADDSELWKYRLLRLQTLSHGHRDIPTYLRLDDLPHSARRPHQGEQLISRNPVFQAHNDGIEILEIELEHPNGRRQRILSRLNHLRLKTPLDPGRYKWRYRFWPDSQPPADWSTTNVFDVPRTAMTSPVDSANALFAKARSAPRPRTIPQALNKFWPNRTRFSPINETLIKNLDRRLVHARLDLISLDAQNICLSTQVHRISSALGLLSARYRLTDDLKAVLEIIRILRTLASIDTSVAAVGSRNDLCNSTIAMYEAIAFDFVVKHLSPAEKRDTIQSIEKRVNETLIQFVDDPSTTATRHPYRPHAYRNIFSVLAISTLMAGETIQAKRWFMSTVTFLQELGNVWIGSDGGYALGAHYAALELNNYLLKFDIIQNTTGFPVYQLDWIRQFAL